MSSIDQPAFGLQFSNLPIVNARTEFDHHLKLLRNSEFRESLHAILNPVVLPEITWRGLPYGALTFMLQRAILSLEACVGAAVDGELRKRKVPTAEEEEWLRDPNKIPGQRGMAQMFYNNLPGLVDPAFQLQVVDPALWRNVYRFYREVRNPLFHGDQLSIGPSEPVLEIFEMLNTVYSWMDLWWTRFPYKQLKSPYRGAGAE
jgi:hypothetical protein